MDKRGLSVLMVGLILLSMMGISFNPLLVHVPSVEGSSTDWWPTFHHDASRTGYTTSPGPNAGNVLWQYSTGGYMMYSAPAIVDGRVYATYAAVGTYCIDAVSGKNLWNSAVGHGYCSPTVAGGKVYVASRGDGIVYCLDASSGASLWSYPTGGGGGGGVMDSSPAFSNGFLYVGATNGKVYCLDASTGAFVWSYPTGSLVDSSPAVVNGMVYVGSQNGNVYCLNASDGAFIWSYLTGGQVDSSPAVANGMVYVGSGISVYCLNASIGAFVWSYPTGGSSVISSPSLAYGEVYEVGGDGYVYCLGASSGTFVWRYYIGGLFSSPAVAGGNVYVGETGSHNVYCLSASAGTVVWKYLTNGPVYSSPAVANGMVYVGSNDGNLYCLGQSAYSVTINAHDNTQGVDVSVPITMDGSPSGHNTSYAFGGLTGSHTFAVPSTDSSGHPFLKWSTGETTTAITVSPADGAYTAYYQAAPPPSYSVAISAHCNMKGIDVSVAIAMDGISTGYSTPHTFTGLTGSHNFTVSSTDADGDPFKQWSTCQTTTTIKASSGGIFTAYYGQDPVTLEVIQNPIVNPTGPQFQVRLQSTVSILLGITTDMTIMSYQALIYTVNQADFLSAFSTKDLTFTAPVSIVNNTLLEVNFTVRYAYNSLNRVENQSILAIASDGTGFPTSLAGALVMIDDPSDSTFTLNTQTVDPAWQSSVLTSSNYNIGVFGFSSNPSTGKYLEPYPISLQSTPSPLKDNIENILETAKSDKDKIDIVVNVVDLVKKVSPKTIPIPSKTWNSINDAWTFLGAELDGWYNVVQWVRNPTPKSNNEYFERLFTATLIGATIAAVVVGSPALAALATVVGVGYAALKSSDQYSSLRTPFLDETLSTEIEPGYNAPSAVYALVPCSQPSSVTVFDNSGPLQGLCTAMVPIGFTESSSSGLVLHYSYDQTTGKMFYYAVATAKIQPYQYNGLSNPLYEVQHPNQYEVDMKVISTSGSASVLMQEQNHDLSLGVQANGEYVGLDANGSIHIGIPGAWFSGQTWPIKEILLPDNCSAFDIVVSGSEAQLPTEQLSLTISTTNATGQIVKTGSFVSSINQNETLDYAVSLTNASGFQVMSVAPSKNVVGQGYQLPVNVMLMNMGNQSETFNVTAYINTTVLGSQNVTVTSGNSTILTFTWNTTGFVKGNYTICARALDNNFTGGWVYVAMVGDVDGDNKVDVKDVYAVAKAYGTSLEGPNPPGRIYSPNFDINGDGKIDIKDYYIVCRHYGEVDP